MPDRPYSELRKEIFGGSDNTAQEASPSFQGMSYADFKANHLNQSTPNEAELSPFTSTVKYTSAGILNSLAGQPVEDIGKLTGSEGLQNFGKGVREYAEGVQKANPSQINSLGDIVDKPVTAVKTALGNLVPQVPLSMAGAYAGAKAGAALPLPANLKPIASAIGAGAGMFVPSYAQEYSEMRGKQNESGQEDIGKAALAAIPAAGLETAADYVGLGRLVPNGITGDVLQEGASRLAHVGKQALKGAGAESGTEYLQTGLEQYGGNEDLTTDQAANERNVSAALGGIGGGMMRGGISAFDQRQTNVVTPEQEQAEVPKGPLSRAAGQANVAPVENTNSAWVSPEFNVNTRQAGLQPWSNPAFNDVRNPALNPSGQAEQINPTVLQDEQPTEQSIQSANSIDNINPARTDDAMVSSAGSQLETSRIDSSGDNQETANKHEEYVNNETGRLLDLITQNDKSPSFGNSVLLKLAKLNGVDSSQYSDPKVLLSDIASIHAERNKPQTANDVQYVSPVEDKPIDSSKPENLENRIHDETVITKVGNKSLEENEDQFIRRLMRNNRSHTYDTAKEAFNKKLAQQQEINDNTARPETASTGTDSRNAITSIDETGDSLSGAASRDTDTTANSTGFSQQVDTNEKEKAKENIEVNADSVRPAISGDQSVDAQQGNGRGLDGELGDRAGNGVSGLRGGLSEGERYLSGELYSDTDNAIPDKLTQQENNNENATNTSSVESTTETNVNESQSELRQNGRQLDQQTAKPVQQVSRELVKATETYPQVKALVDGGVEQDSVIMAARDLASGDDGLVKHLAKKHQIQLPEQETAKPTQAPVETLSKEQVNNTGDDVYSQLGHENNRYRLRRAVDSISEFNNEYPEAADILSKNLDALQVSVVGGSADKSRNINDRKDLDLVFHDGYRSDNTADPDVVNAISRLQQYINESSASKGAIDMQAMIDPSGADKNRPSVDISKLVRNAISSNSQTNNVQETQQAKETAAIETPAAETTVKAPSQESNGELSYDELIARNKKEKQEKLDAIAPHENDAYESLSDTDKKFLSKRSGYFWKGEQYKDIAKHVLVDRDVRLVKEGKPNLNNLGSEPTEFEYKLSDGRRSSKVPSAVGRYIEALQGKLNEQADKTEQTTTSAVDNATTPSREEQGSDTGTQVDVVKQYPTEKAEQESEVKTEETAPNHSGRKKLNFIFKRLGRNSYKSASEELKSEIDNHPDAELIKQIQKHWSDVLLDVGYENKEDSNKPNSKVFIEC
jgi:hypothetical protein